MVRVGPAGGAGGDRKRAAKGIGNEPLQFGRLSEGRRRKKPLKITNVFQASVQ